MFLNGSDSNNGVKDFPLDFSTMKFLNLDGSDTEDILMIRRRTSTLSLMQIKNKD